MSELLVILVLALVVVGPQDLPKVARWLARALRSVRNMVRDFSSALNIDEEMKEVKEAGNLLRDTVQEINPVTDLTSELIHVKKETEANIRTLTDFPEALKDELITFGNGKDKMPAPGAEKKA
jgi:sec-independent protein translocase protein TatB